MTDLDPIRKGKAAQLAQTLINDDGLRICSCGAKRHSGLWQTTRQGSYWVAPRRKAKLLRKNQCRRAASLC